MVGEENLAFDILGGKLTVEFAPSMVTSENVIKTVARTGMRAEV